MNDDPILIALLVLVAILPVGDLIATVFFARLFWRSKSETDREAPLPVATDTIISTLPQRASFLSRLLGNRSWLLALLTASFAVITLAFAVIGFLATRRLFGLQPLEHGALLTVFVLILLGLIPIAFMVAFLLTRRRRGGVPPPFGRQD